MNIVLPLIFVSSLIMLLSIFLGVYIPYTKRYVYLQCSRINSTHSKSNMNCKTLVFRGSASKSCILDTTTNNIILYDLDYINLVYITSTIFVSTVVMNIVHFINTLRFRQINQQS